jgi:DNA invertase Pin-like site-specific DNA recombinase
VVWKLDWLGRSLRRLVDTVTRLGERGIGCRSLQETLDTITPAASRQRPLKLYYLSACLRPQMGTV